MFPRVDISIDPQTLFGSGSSNPQVPITLSSLTVLGLDFVQPPVLSKVNEVNDENTPAWDIEI